jgi:hypothetical protein
MGGHDQFLLPGVGGNIPPELFALIIRHVWTPAYLMKFCLISKAWCKFAQPALFHTIYLTRERWCQHWITRFTTFPHLAKFVKELIFWTAPPDGFAQDFAWAPMPHYVNSAAFERLIPLLCSVTTLELGETFANWSRVEPRIRLLMPLKKIQTLILARKEFNQHEIFDLIRPMPLRHLKIYEHVLIAPVPSFVIPSDFVPIRLQRIVLHLLDEYTLPVPTSLFDFLSSPIFDYSELSEILIEWDAEPGLYQACSSMQSFLRRIAPTVRDFSFKSRSQSEDWMDDPFLSRSSS